MREFRLWTDICVLRTLPIGLGNVPGRRDILRDTSRPLPQPDNVVASPVQKVGGPIAPQFRLSGSLVVPPGFCLRPDLRSGRAHPSRVPSNHTPRFSGREEADPSCRPSPASRRRGGRFPGIKVELRGSATLSSKQGLMHSPVTRHQLHPLVAPQVLHFMHVPLRTKV